MIFKKIAFAYKMTERNGICYKNPKFPSNTKKRSINKYLKTPFYLANYYRKGHRVEFQCCVKLDVLLKLFKEEPAFWAPHFGDTISLI